MAPAAGLVSAALLVGTALAVRSAARASARLRARSRLAPTGTAVGPSRTGVGLPPPAWLCRRLDVAGVEADPAQLWTAWVVTGAAAVPAGILAAGPGLGAVVGLVLGGGPLLALAISADRRDRLLEAALPEVLEGMARAVRSGASLRLALAEAGAAVPGALGADLRSLAAAAAGGVPLAPALDGWAERRPLPGVRLAVAAVGLGAETGGAQARALDGVAQTLRGRLGVAAEVRSLSSQARLSGLVIALSPLAFSALATATDARTAAFLFRSVPGLGCLALGLALDAAAAVWMTRLCRVEA